MNSTTSTEPVQFAVDQQVFVPFWSLLEFLDTTPPDPFLKCRITALFTRTLQSPDGPVVIPSCNLEIKPGLMADGFPLEYLVGEGDLESWKRKIADWFLSYTP